MLFRALPQRTQSMIFTYFLPVDTPLICSEASWEKNTA